MAVRMLKIREDLQLFVVLLELADKIGQRFGVIFRTEVKQNADLVHLVVIDCVAWPFGRSLSGFLAVPFQHEIFDQIFQHSV